MSLREGHLDYLFKLTIQESSLHIKLLGDKPICTDNGQEEVQGIDTYHQGKRLIVVLSLNLAKLLCD
jgi:hypothetical protein